MVGMKQLTGPEVYKQNRIDKALRSMPDAGLLAVCYQARATPEEVRERAKALGVEITGPRVPKLKQQTATPYSFDEMLQLYASEEAELCPECGCYYVVPWASSARLGICPICFKRHEADVMRDYGAFLAVIQEKDALKQNNKRTRDRLKRRGYDVPGMKDYLKHLKEREGKENDGTEETNWEE